MSDLLKEYKTTDDPYGVAGKIVKSMGKGKAYNLATALLSYLEDGGYCIWQTYTKDDIRANTGKRVTKEYMADLGESLQCFENMRVY